MKLHLGCGTQKFRGYINIDSNEDFSPDLCIDYLEIVKHFKSDTVSEIIAIHSLYSLTYSELISYLKSLRSILAPGGILIIESPDLQKMLQKILAGQIFCKEASIENYTELVRPLLGLGFDDCWGVQVNKRSGHLACSLLMSRLLSLVGFEHVFSEPPRYHYRDRDYRVVAEKPRNGATRGSILCVANKSAPASTNVRCIEPMKGLKSLGWNIDLVYYEVLRDLLNKKSSILSSYDIFYCMKCGDSKQIIDLKKFINSSQKVVYDVVDSLWNVAHYGIAETALILKSVDYIFCENPYLQFQATNLSNKESSALFVRAGIDTSYFDKVSIQTVGPLRNSKKRVVIGWSGSTYTLPGLLKISKAIESFGVAMGEGNVLLRIILMGAPRDLDLPKLDCVETETVFYGYDETALANLLASLDIGLYPKPYDDDEFLGRGYGKGYLYMAAGVPSIWSKSNGNQINDEFTPPLSPGQDFLVAGEIEDWERALSCLIANPDLRANIVRNGREAAGKLFSRSRALHSLDSAFLHVSGDGVYSNQLR
jgi:glycosyltransferase involved in cell wall biosynthesis